MYEHSPSGLGWETLYQTNWYGGQTETPLRCIELQDRGVPGEEAEQRCFKGTSPEQTLAIQSECERIGFPCETGGEGGSSWCCAPGRPDRQLREGEVFPGEPEVTVVPPGDPTTGHRHSFMSKLSHPGALAALGLIAVVGYFGYRGLVAQNSRWALHV